MKGVYCEDCVYYQKCMEARKVLGIETLIQGKVDCDRYVKSVKKDERI